MNEVETFYMVKNLRPIEKKWKIQKTSEQPKRGIVNEIRQCVLLEIYN